MNAAPAVKAAAPLFPKVSAIHPDAKVTLEHGTFFVCIETGFGRLVLGWGETVKQAVEAAKAKQEG